MTSRELHDARVTAWLERCQAAGLPRESLLDLFETALAALWARTSTSLGEITLSAIADRVLHDAGERYPPFASLNVEATGRLEAGELRHNVESLGHMELLEGMRFVLVEFLTVLGNLTAGLLTAELHAELARVAPSRAPRRSPRRLSRSTSQQQKGRA